MLKIEFEIIRDCDNKTPAYKGMFRVNYDCKYAGQGIPVFNLKQATDLVSELFGEGNYTTKDRYFRGDGKLPYMIYSMKIDFAEQIKDICNEVWPDLNISITEFLELVK